MRARVAEQLEGGAVRVVREIDGRRLWAVCPWCVSTQRESRLVPRGDRVTHVLCDSCARQLGQRPYASPRVVARLVGVAWVVLAVALWLWLTGCGEYSGCYTADPLEHQRCLIESRYGDSGSSGVHTPSGP